MAMLKMLNLVKFMVMVKKKKMMVKEDDDDGCGDGELSAIRGSQLPPLPRLHNGTSKCTTCLQYNEDVFGKLGSLCLMESVA